MTTIDKLTKKLIDGYAIYFYQNQDNTISIQIKGKKFMNIFNVEKEKINDDLIGFYLDENTEREKNYLNKLDDMDKKTVVQVDEPTISTRH